MFIKDNSAWIDVETACKIFELSRSAYYEWWANEDARIEAAIEYTRLSIQIELLFYRYKSRYGARRITDEFFKRGTKCSYDKVSKIMHDKKLVPIGYKKYKVTTTNSNHKYKVFDNLLERNFIVDKPNQVYVGDITYIRTNEGWLYLAVVIDLYSRKVIGYKMSNRMTKDIVISALLQALKVRGYPKEVIIHSDRGSQYASNEYKRILKQYGLRGSMSKKGDCWDNAVAESFFASLKKEYVHHTLFATRIQAQLGIFDYIEAWYNNERAHSTIGGLSPNEFETINQNKFVNNRKKVKSKIMDKNNFIGISIS